MVKGYSGFSREEFFFLCLRLAFKSVDGVMQIALPNVDRRLPIVDGLNRTKGWPSGHELEQTPGDGEGQGSLVCCLSCVSKSQTQLSD